MSKKLGFKHIRDTFKRGTAMPESVNSSMLSVVNLFGIPELLNLFKRGEENRWFGTLMYPVNEPKFKFVFRFGVCQSFTTRHIEGRACFDQITINQNVEFSE